MKRARFVRAAALLWAILLSTTGTSLAQQGTADPVLRAMSDELERSISGLQLSDMDKPYFIQYTVVDEDEYTAEATFGALTLSRLTRQRVVQAQIRIGGYEFDNSEFVTGQGPAQMGAVARTVIDNDYDALRHALWLATDASYKQSVEVFARKRAFVQNRMEEEQLPEFSREGPTNAIAPRQSLEFDRPLLERRLRDWSGLFRSFADIQTSSVTLRARLNHRYIANSEGTRTLQPELVVSLEVEAAAQTPDGQRITHSIPFRSRSFEKLPAPEVVSESIRRLAGDLAALRSAPLLDSDYSGPVLLTGSASAEMFGRVLAPNLSGQRPPLSERPPQGPVGSELLNRINRPVLPLYFSVFDDPSQVSAGGAEVIGHYQVDDQGVPARRVTLVEDGLLTDLLMSRRPGKGRPQSNGHGRSGFPGRETAQIGNLFISAREGKTYAELIQELIKLGKIERLQYCLVIKSIDPNGRGPIGAPILTYKVYVADGREELVRGASSGEVAVGMLRHIQAAGDDAFVANRLIGTRGAETPASVIAPSVLLEEMEVRRPSDARQKPALLTHPYFEP